MVDGKNRKGETPLMFARTLDIAKLLVARGADPMAQDNAGFTALMHVVDAGAPGDDSAAAGGLGRRTYAADARAGQSHEQDSA